MSFPVPLTAAASVRRTAAGAGSGISPGLCSAPPIRIVSAPRSDRSRTRSPTPAGAGWPTSNDASVKKSPASPVVKLHEK